MERKDRSEFESYDHKLIESIIRAKRNVMDLAYCNRFDYFCTFTVNGERADRYDLSGCRKKLSRLFDNYRQRYSRDFRYLVIAEFHKDGAIHFHGLVAGIRDCDLIINEHGYLDWPYYSKKLGYFSCGKIKSRPDCARYITKYITKDIAKLPKGQQVYLHSKGLKKPDLVFDMDDVPMVGNPTFENEHVRIKWQKSRVTDDLFDIIDEPCADLYIEDEPEKEPDILEVLEVLKIPV